MINRANLTIDEEINRRLPAAEKAIRDLKKKQFIGFDSLEDVASQVGFFTVTLAPGDTFALVVQYSGSAHELYRSELGLSTFINFDNNFAYRWPDGASLTPDLFAFDRTPTYDLSLSDEVGLGIKSYVLMLRNRGTASKTIYQRHALIIPKGAIPS